MSDLARVLVLMPTEKDGERTSTVLDGVGISSRVAADLANLCAQIGEGAGAVLFTEDAIHHDTAGLLRKTLAAQPAWSTIPLVVLSHESLRTDLAQLLPEAVANVTLVERPVRVRTLISVVRAALRARQQQYQIRDALAERDRQALAIAEQGERLVFALTAGKLGSWELGVATRALETSALARATFGRAPDAPFDYADLIASIHPADRARVLAALDAALADRTEFDVEYRVIWADDSVHWVLTRGRATYDRDGAARRMVGVLLDVTELRQNENALIESEGRYRTLVEQINEYAIFTTSTDGHATSWNPGVRRVLEMEERDFVGLDAAELFTPEDVAAGVPQRELDEAARTGSASNDRWMLTRSGRRFFAMGVTTALRDQAGRLVGFSKVMRDQTSWMRTQEELTRIAAALKEADRRKDEFLATLAHELRNPLAPIRTGLQVIKVAPTGANAERAREMMERQLAHMVRLIDDLLDVSRITRGKVELKRERMTLDSAIDAAIEASRPLIDAAKHRITVTKPPEPLWVDGDLTRLAQVLANLVNNAAKYTPRNGHIAIRVRAEEGFGLIEVADDGVGIPPDKLGEVFEMFSQVNRTLDRAQGGLGIGLALVRKLIALHGGTVSAHSDGLGKGSTFTVRLPLAESPRPSAVPQPANGASNGASRRILVVDDNVDGADCLSMLLSLAGHDTRTAHDGPEALSAASEFDPEVVFLDIGLPGMSGYDVARKLRAEGKPATLIALTGWGSESDKQQAMDAGFDFHLTKPVEPAMVEALLTRVVGAGG